MHTNLINAIIYSSAFNASIYYVFTIAVNQNYFFQGYMGSRFTCPNSCGKSYKNKRSIWSHLKFECGREPQFECFICLKKFKYKSNMAQHLSLVHSHNVLKYKYV